MMTTFELLVDISNEQQIQDVVHQLNADGVLTSYLHNKGLTLENHYNNFAKPVRELALELRAADDLLNDFIDGIIVYTAEGVTMYSHSNGTFFSVKVDGISVFNETKEEATQTFLEYLKP